MRGVEIVSADNSLICGLVEFRVNGKYERYRVRFHPDFGMALDIEHNDGWKEVKRNASNSDIEAILPEVRGERWTFNEFQAYWLAWEEGYRKGFARGESQAWREMRTGER